jgi:DNA-binding NtrC family response regulator
LNPVTLTIPPLRDRREDIPDLVNYHLKQLRTRIHRHVTGVSPETIACLCRYDWPGNIRELINVLERAMLLCRDSTIMPVDLPETVRQPISAVGQPPPSPVPEGARGRPSTPLRSWREVRTQALEEIKRAYFSALLREYEGRIGAAARHAGLHPRSLFDHLRKLGLRKEDFRYPPAITGP